MLSDGHAAVRLADGRVLVTGGRHPTLGTTAAAAIYDPDYRPGPFLTHMPIESISGMRSPRISSVLDHHVPRTGVPAAWRSPYTCTSSCNSDPTPCQGSAGELQVRAFDGQLGDAIFGANDPPAGFPANDVEIDHYRLQAVLARLGLFVEQKATQGRKAVDEVELSGRYRKVHLFPRRREAGLHFFTQMAYRNSRRFHMPPSS